MSRCLTSIARSPRTGFTFSHSSTLSAQLWQWKPNGTFGNLRWREMTFSIPLRRQKTNFAFGNICARCSDALTVGAVR
jgi:hypothetical protein